MVQTRSSLITFMVPGFPRSLFERVAELAGMELIVDETASGPPAGQDPFAAGVADAGWICSTSYVELGLRSAAFGRPPSIELAGVAWIPDDPDVAGTPHYFGDIVVRAESRLNSLEELAGARIGCNDEVSLSGHHALRFALTDRGHNPDRFADLVFTGGHRASLDALLDGSLDAAVVDSVVRTNAERAGLDPASIRVIERLGPWPVQPLVVASRLSPERKKQIRGTVLGSNRDPRMQAELAAASLLRFSATTPAYYQPVHTAMMRA